MRPNQELLDEIICELDDFKDDYDLAGVEITYDDAQQVIDFMNDGATRDQALDAVLSGIRDCLSQGWDF